MVETVFLFAPLSPPRREQKRIALCASLSFLAGKNPSLPAWKPR